MRDELFRERVTVKSLTEGISKLLNRDYLRLIEYCEREIRVAQAARDLMKTNPIQSLTPKEVSTEINHKDGEIRALEGMIEYIQKREVYEEVKQNER